MKAKLVTMNLNNRRRWRRFSRHGIARLYGWVDNDPLPTAPGGRYDKPARPGDDRMVLACGVCGWPLSTLGRCACNEPVALTASPR